MESNSSSQLATTPDVYSPGVDESGNYVDVIPSNVHFTQGLMCSCGSRRAKVYASRQQFAQHIKTQTHQIWLANMNLSKANYYAKSVELEQLVNSQKVTIGQLQRESERKDITIMTLTSQLAKYAESCTATIPNKVQNSIPTANLLDFLE